MNAPNSWLFADNSRYSTRSRLLFMGLSFTIGILTFLIYLAIWYTCSRSSRRQRQRAVADIEAAAAAGAACDDARDMSAAAIAALPTFAYEVEQAGAADCAVCLGQLEAGEKVRWLPKCAHLFHADCVDAWLRAHSTCPMCRAAVEGPAAAAASKKGGAANTDTNTTPAAPAATAAAEELPPV